MIKKEKFISIIFKNPQKESVINLLCDFLKGLIGNYIEPSLSNNALTVFIDSDTEVDFEEIINSLNSDFYVFACLFESGELYKGIDKNEYVKYINSISSKLLETTKLYIDEKELVKQRLNSSIVENNILKEYYKDYEMRNVISTYLESNMNVSQAASALYMHRNTVMNKIAKFIDVTGYDIKKFQNAFVIYQIL
jgi:DNA-binding NtrC family response regulator